MKSVALLSLAGLFALSACSGGGTAAPAIPVHAPTSSTAASHVTLSPFRMPLATGETANVIASRTRHVKDGAGGIPTFLLDILLCDAPSLAPGAQVNLAIVGVEGLSGGTAYPIVSYTQPVVVNVLQLQTSALELGKSPIPALKYDGLRFVIDPSLSSVLNAGVTFGTSFGIFDNSFMFTPIPGSTANLDFMQPFDLTSGPAGILVDFNVAESVNLTQNGIAEIGPHLTGTTWSDAAVITGSVRNAAGNAVAGATVVALGPDGAIATSTLTDFSGNFQLHAIPGDTYSLVVYNTFVAPSGVTYTAINADGSAPVNGPSFTVPAGYQANVGTIKD